MYQTEKMTKHQADAGKVYKRITGILLAAALVLSGCGTAGTEESQNVGEEEHISDSGKLRFKVEPETFSLTVFSKNTELTASRPGDYGRVEVSEVNEDTITLLYPEQNLKAVVGAEEDYIGVELISTAEKEDNSGKWPIVGGEVFYLPLGEGKRIPAADKRWQEYLTETDISLTEGLSMPFFAVSQQSRALVYIIEDPYRMQMHFEAADGLTMGLQHHYPGVFPEKSVRFRIYVTDDEAVQIAGCYKNYVREQGKFVTLEEKAQLNSNIRKLYGAPHIYLWCGRAISPEDINWSKFREQADGSRLRYLAGYLEGLETGSMFGQILDEIKKQDYVSKYQKNVICQGITEVVRGNDFYRRDIFPETSELMKQLLRKDKLAEPEQIMLNKAALYENLTGVFAEPEKWGARESKALIKELESAGLESAWIGLDNWENAWIHPDMAEAAVNAGYLIGPYDSYHSIHEPGKEQWNTAAFEEKSLYEQAVIEDKNGKKVSGFNQVGRKLNPTLALPSVKKRVEHILSTGVPFNSWFVDCDAAGEIYDDYSPAHQTTKEMDVEARVERLQYIGKQRNMVTGSEGGSDYASAAIAFSHGIELPSFAWRDKDMKENKESEYYIGRYYSASGGVPEHFGKKIPLKEEWKYIFTDISFDVPLYRMVYNDSVITSYHWDWSTLKIEGEEKNRMIREILYNVPPLYHLDRETWNADRETIVEHVHQWSDFAADAVQEEMTDFQYLSEDRRVQKTVFGEKIEVVANFSDGSYRYGTTEIPAGSVLILRQDSKQIYTPRIY